MHLYQDIGAIQQVDLLCKYNIISKNLMIMELRNPVIEQVDHHLRHGSLQVGGTCKVMRWETLVNLTCVYVCKHAYDKDTTSTCLLCMIGCTSCRLTWLGYTVAQALG